MAEHEPAFDDLLDDEDESSSPGASRRWGRIGLIVGALAVLMFVVAAIAWGPTAVALVRERGATIATPDHAAGLTRDTSDRARQTTDELQNAIAANVPFDKVTAVVYRDPANADRSVVIMAGTVTTLHPANELSDLFGALADASGGATGLHDVDPGPLGGTARCGRLAIDPDVVPVCGWADHGSAAIMLFPGRSDAEAPALLRRLRGALLHRG